MDSAKHKSRLRHPGNAESIVRDILEQSCISINKSNHIVTPENHRLIRDLLCFSTAVALIFSSLAFFRSAEADDPVLLIESTWIRETPPGVPTLAAYMNITNITASPISIINVTSDAAKMTELHEVKMENDIMQMRKMPKVTIEPGEILELKAGGSHVMLMGVQENFREGDQIEIEFELSELPPVKVIVPVKKDS